MDETALARAEEAYKAGDWRAAAREYLLLAGSGGLGTGTAFVKAGNALLRLGRSADAAMAYERALTDPGLKDRAATLCNLGVARAAAGDHEGAIAAFEEALQDTAYQARYRALQGLAASLAAVGRLEEACEMYRAAALEASNPDPGKALNNLGLCQMALGRNDDAAEAFKAALGVDAYGGKGKALSNLGLALAALGRHAEAVECFGRATVEHGHSLSSEALAAYDECKAALEASARETVEGWRTGEMAPVIPEADDEGLAFFTRTEEEMREADRAARRAERDARKSQKGWLARIGSAVALIAMAVGLIGFLWTSGIGFPTQQMTVKGLLEAHRTGKPVEGYWVAVPPVDVEKEMSSLPPHFASYSINKIGRSAKTSSVDVTVILEQGAPLTYRISLAREGVGWKVTGVANDWRSTEE